MISIDFVVELPESAKFNMIITVVNSIFKIAYFILTHTTVSTEGVVRLFLYYM